MEVTADETRRTPGNKSANRYRGGAPGPRRETLLKAAQRREQVAALMAMCLTIEEISKRTGTSRSIVFKDTQVIRKQWADRAVKHVDQFLGRALHNLENQERETVIKFMAADQSIRERYQAWQRSEEAVRTGFKYPPFDKELQALTTEAGQCIDRRLRIIDRQVALLGLNKQTVLKHPEEQKAELSVRAQADKAVEDLASFLKGLDERMKKEREELKRVGSGSTIASGEVLNAADLSHQPPAGPNGGITEPNGGSAV